MSSNLINLYNISLLRQAFNALDERADSLLGQLSQWCQLNNFVDKHDSFWASRP